MYHYVYLTTNKITGKQYVGDRSVNDIENDRYLGSGVHIKISIKKYGKDNFHKEILETFDFRSEAYKAQEKFINIYNTLEPNGYNISPKGGCNEKNSHSEESKKKISKHNKGKILSESTKEKIRQSKLNISDETKKKIGIASANRSLDSNYRCGSTNRGKETWMKGKHHTDESKELNRQKHLGIKHSEESNKKKSLPGNKNGMFGKSFYQVWVEKYGVVEADIKMKNWKEKIKNNKKK